MHLGVLRKEGWPTHKEQKIMKGKNMKNEDMKALIEWTGKTPDQLNKLIDKDKDTPEWKRTASSFSKKAMEKLLVSSKLKL